MKIPIFTVDAFTDKPFSGNPAGVCVLNSPLDEKLMQNIAFEMNLSETAFLNKKDASSYSLRWFTPVVEVDLCGHATLASAHILWETKKENKSSEIEFNTKSGILKANFRDAGIELDFPLMESKPVEIPKGLIKALGVEPINLFRAQWNYIAELDSEKTVRNVKPDFDLLRALEAWGTIITARASKESAADGYDFVSRFFAPAKGVKEDPVTGSAHSALAPYWMNRIGKNTFKAYQASERGGTLGLKVGNGRVYITGMAVTVLNGSINV